MPSLRILSPIGVLVIVAATSASMILFDGFSILAFYFWTPLAITSFIGIVVIMRDRQSETLAFWSFLREAPLTMAFGTLLLAPIFALILWRGAGLWAKRMGLGEFVPTGGGAVSERQAWVFAQNADFIIAELALVAFWAVIGVLVGRRRVVAGVLFGLSVFAAFQLWIWSVYVLD